MTTLVFVILLAFLCSACGSVGGAGGSAIGDDGSTQPAQSAPSAATTKTAQQPKATALPAVAKWSNFNRDVGSISSVENLPDWVGGKAQRVHLVGGRGLLEGDHTLWLYLVKNEVSIAYEMGDDGNLRVFGHYGPTFELTRPVRRAASADLPAYTVLFAAQDLFTVGIEGNVLVPSIGRSASAAKRESVFRRIAAREGLLTAAFYSNKEAYKADASESYARSHPSALKRGFTGLLIDGKFKASPAQ
jgi:hypothetical protein